MKKVIVIAVILAAVTGVAYWKWSAIKGLFAKEVKEAPVADRLFTVELTSFKVVLNEQGNLKSKKSTKIKVPNFNIGQTKIVWLIEDGTKVKKDDKVTEFEKQQIETNIKKQEEDLESRKNKLEIAEQRLALAQEREQVKWTSSEKSLEQTKKNKEKYITLEAPKKYADLQVGMRKVEERVEEARKAVTAAQEKISEELFVDDSQRVKNEAELANKKRQYQTSLKELESTQLQMKIYRRHTHPEKLKKLDDDIQSKIMQLEDAKIAAKSDINEAQHSVDQLKIRVKQLEDSTKKAKETLEKTILKAPVDGIVHIGDPDQRRWGGNNQIEVGAQVWRGRVIAHIPDSENFEVSTDIPENSRSKVQKGLDVTVTLPAVPDLILTGKIFEVANKAHNRISWDPSSPKAFNIKIDVKGNDERLVSGMTARVEIFVEEIKDVLVVPIESVFVEEDKNYLYRHTQGNPEKVFVETKQSNEHFVAVEGVAEGDRVYLFDPFK